MASSDNIADAMLELCGGSDEESTPKVFLDTGYPPLNYALSCKWNGGVPVGRIIEVFGPPSAGKTAVSTCAMKSAQDMGGFSMFMDHERTFSLKLAKKIGLDVDPNKLLFKKPRTFEDSIDLVVKVSKHLRDNQMIPDEAPICVIFDSLAAMIPRSKLLDQKGEDRDTSTYNMHDNSALARATSSAFGAFALHCEELNIAAIFLNQTRQKLGVMFGDPTTTPGGDSPKFYSSIRVQLGGGKIEKGTGTSKEVIGKNITAKIIKNKVSRPFLTANWRFVFQEDGTGKFDVVRSTIDFLVEEKRMKAAGARVEWTDGKSYFKDVLARKIEDEGLIDDLFALLPEEHEPEVMGVMEIAAAEAADAELEAKYGKKKAA